MKYTNLNFQKYVQTREMCQKFASKLTLLRFCLEIDKLNSKKYMQIHIVVDATNMINYMMALFYCVKSPSRWL